MKCKKIFILFLALFALVSVLALSAAADASFDEASNYMTYSFLDEGFSSHPGYLGMYVDNDMICIQFDLSFAGQTLEISLGTVGDVIDHYEALYGDFVADYLCTCGYESDGLGFYYSVYIESAGEPVLQSHSIPKSTFSMPYLGSAVPLSCSLTPNGSGECYLSYFYMTPDDVYDIYGRSNSEYAFLDFADIPTSPPAVSGTDDGSVLPVLGEMIGILTGGIPLFAAGLGDGLSELVLNVFTNGSGSDMTLSVFGAVLIIFSGLALAIGLSKFIVGWVTSFGSSG